MKFISNSIIIITSLALVSCATYKSTLINSKGEMVTCEVSGKNGILTGRLLKNSFDDCVEDARKRGFGERSMARTPQAQAERVPPSNAYSNKPSVVSKYDYQAREKAREKNCVPKATPSVLGIGQAQEIFGFECEDGRELIIKCGSIDGCNL